MLELVSVKRDARPERQSSYRSGQALVPIRRATVARALRLSFAAFVLLHFATQAYRADTDGALPGSGVERASAVVAALFLLLWLPFTVLSLWQARRSLTRGALPAAGGQQRALAVVEPLSLAIVLLFGTAHGALMAWPRLSGSLDEADLRAELVAGLSSTWHGFPMHGIAYLCAVGAASFCAARLTLAALPTARAGFSRAVVGLAVLGYLLGSYAVIRCGSGSLLP